MPKDKRKKGCPNKNCEMHANGEFQTVENDFCPKCGAELVFVCSKCFTEIEDKGIKHHKCEHCKLEAQEKREKIKETIKDASKPIITGLGGVATVAVTSFSKDLTKHAEEIGKVAAEKAIKVVLRK